LSNIFNYFFYSNQLDWIQRVHRAPRHRDSGESQEKTTMAIMKKLGSIPAKMPYGTAKPGFKGFLVDKSERAAAAFAFGAAKGYYGERFLWKGHGADAWIGGFGLLAIGAARVFAGPRTGRLLPHVERVVDAAYMSALGSIGASWGMDQAGRSVHVSTPGKNALSPKSTVLGHIPQAMGGAYLSPDEIQRFASKR
jgi:hypothetical protein